MGALTERIKSRLLDQQRDGDDWDNFLSIIAAEFEEIIDILVDLSTLTWLDTATGVWLDRIGEIVGVKRPSAEEVDNIFTVCDTGDADETGDSVHCWGDDDHALEGGYVWDDDGVLLGGEADDDDYLEFIKAKIYATQADASIPGLALYVLNCFDLATTVTTPTPGEALIVLPASGFDLRQKRYLEIFCPAMAGINVTFSGWPED